MLIYSALRKERAHNLMISIICLLTVSMATGIMASLKPLNHECEFDFWFWLISEL